jgi:Trk K+ transport system NAD-binding subunit
VSGLFFISIRRLRAPLVFIIVVFAVSTAGLALIPGVDADGRPWRPSLFEAFYFVTYTATTIGFGELPFAFTNLQRLWVTGIIYLSVIGWAYLLGSLLALFQDKGFQAAVVAARFGRTIRHLREPFYLLCGLGETGLTVARALDRMGTRFVAVDAAEAGVLELDLGDFATDPPGLAGDVRSPATLLLAGLGKQECRGVLALTADDRANLAIAVAARLLHPGLRVIGRAHSSEIMDAMATAGVAEIINPYREFAERLAIAMRAPDTHRLLTWLTGPPGSRMPPRIPPPPGRWIVCGYGRFGEEVTGAILRGGFDVTAIDPDGPPAPGLELVRGLGFDEAALRRAGIAEAEGLVAGSDDDTANLAMAMAARKLRPQIFLILRQNREHNRALFRALDADMIMVPSEIIADECIALLRARHLSSFLATACRRDNDWSAEVTTRLEPIVGPGSPAVWSVTLRESEAPGLLDAMKRAGRATLDDLGRDVADRGLHLDCLPLLLVRAGQRVELPPADTELRPGDELLYAGRERARRAMTQALRNANTAEYVLTGRDRPSSVLARLLDRIRGSAAP